ncbi:hypothetical protein MTR67_039142 [Solanum verrucosum]|uniref:DUF3444 domain-containing protein n=1 Tax=Solanum verrucosum TaxID=315347 RepID=A0AAF0UGP6_SOLVR|nr:hypothetical protein MTR67_039142 [Solanum verrucosum]
MVIAKPLGGRPIYRTPPLRRDKFGRRVFPIGDLPNGSAKRDHARVMTVVKTSVESSENCEESEVQHLFPEESLQSTYDEAETAKGGVDLPSDIGISIMTESKTFEYADPDFSNFDKTRTRPTLRLGKFKLGNSEDIEDHPMFSQLVCEINGNIYDAIKIFPMEGETWALFKDWVMNWCPHLGSNKNFNYEFVEILSNYVVAIDVHVAYFDKAKGSTCLLHRVGDPFLVLGRICLDFLIKFLL